MSTRFWTLVCAASCFITQAASAQDVGGYVQTEWRVLGIGSHISHGPSVSAGLSLFDGVLRVGVTGFARPGPINPATSSVSPSDGGTYRGQSVLELRSDGAFVGPEVALDIPLPEVEWLHLIPSVSAGYAAFGFYLTGANRNTPDGRRVSEWEDELLDGRDAGFGLGLDFGLRLAFEIPGASWIRPTIGGGYFTVVGYDAYAQSAYDGPWGSAGVSVVF